MKNSIPVITANFSPFRMVLKSEKEVPWIATLDQINNNNYDFDSFNEVIGIVDIGIEPYSLAISRDGTLHLPRVDKFLDLNLALYEFNQFLTYIFLGGENVEFVWSDDLGFGFISENKTSIICSDVTGKAGNFHKLSKAGFLGLADRIKLNHPNYVQFQKLKRSYFIGKSIVQSLDGGSLQPILYGATYYKNRNYSESLINFWSITEILIEKFWRKRILSSLEDQTIAIKIKVLYENKLINSVLKGNLDQVRKARNKLAHKGKLPNVEDIKLSITCLFQILSLVTTNFEKYDEYEYLIKMLDNSYLANSGTFNVNQKIEIDRWFKILDDSDDINFIDV